MLGADVLNFHDAVQLRMYLSGSFDLELFCLYLKIIRSTKRLCKELWFRLSLYPGGPLLGVMRSQALRGMAFQFPAEPFIMPNSSRSGSEVWWSRRMPCLQPWWPCSSPTLIRSTSSTEASCMRWSRGWLSGNDPGHQMGLFPWLPPSETPTHWNFHSTHCWLCGLGAWTSSSRVLNSPWGVPTLDTMTCLRKSPSPETNSEQPLFYWSVLQNPIQWDRINFNNNTLYLSYSRKENREASQKGKVCFHLVTVVFREMQ